MNLPRQKAYRDGTPPVTTYYLRHELSKRLWTALLGGGGDDYADLQVRPGGTRDSQRTDHELEPTSLYFRDKMI